MNVLLALNYGNPTSGAFRSGAYLAHQLMRRGIGCHCLVPGATREGREILESLGLEYTCLRYFTWEVGEGDLGRPSAWVRHVIKVCWNRLVAIPVARRCARRCQADVVHINSIGYYAAAYAALDAGIPLVWHLRDLLEEDHGRTLWNRRRALALIDRSSCVVAVSNAVRDKYRRDLPHVQVVTVYNGIPSQEFYAPNRVLFHTGTVRMLMVGRVEEAKGQLQLVRALAFLARVDDVPFDLRIVGSTGDGGYLSEVEGAIREGCLGDRVHLVGPVARPSELYRQCDMLFVCSRAEAFGRVTVEGMLAGCVVVGANSGGTAELVEDGVTGFLYDPRSTKGLTRCIGRVLSNVEEARKVAARAQAHALERYSVEANADALVRVYEDVMGPSSPYAGRTE